MKKTKLLLSNLIYPIALCFVLWGCDIGIFWLLNLAILPIFKWFYFLNFGYKILILFIGGTAIVSIFFNIFSLVSIFVSSLINSLFTYSRFTFWISSFICGLNTIISIVYIWKFLSFDFWIIAMWLALCTFIIQTNWIFVFREVSEEKDESNSLHDNIVSAPYKSLDYYEITEDDINEETFAQVRKKYQDETLTKKEIMIILNNDIDDLKKELN